VSRRRQLYNTIDGCPSTGGIPSFSDTSHSGLAIPIEYINSSSVQVYKCDELMVCLYYTNTYTSMSIVLELKIFFNYLRVYGPMAQVHPKHMRVRIHRAVNEHVATQRQLLIYRFSVQVTVLTGHELDRDVRPVTSADHLQCPPCV